MSENWGKIVQVIGPTVDFEFPSENLPKILNAIEIRDERLDAPVTCEVALHIGNNIVRSVAMSSSDGLVRGMKALDMGGPISVPVGEQTLGRIFNLV